MENIEIARTFDEIADLLDLQGANPFRIRAYRAAARTIGTLGTPVQSLLAADGGRLEELPGIGADLAGKIATLCRTGTLPLIGQLTRKTPESLVTLLKIPGLGPKRARALYDRLGVKTLAQLERAARGGKLKTLRGFGEVTEQAILRGIAQEKVAAARVLLADAEAMVRPLVRALRALPGVIGVEIAGSYRRRAPTVGDVDILVSTARAVPVTRCFLEHPDVARIAARGRTRCAVVLKTGLQVDLRVVRPASFGAALHYFTGSKAHNIAIRALGVKRHLKINEYGVFNGKRAVGGRDEASVFAAVGLPWIPPELREHRGEIEAARDGSLPRLVTLEQIRGDLQMHTTATDGHHSLAEMAASCAARGYEYIAMTDHTHAVRVAGGLTRAGFVKQWREIDRVQREYPRMTILKGAEVDILEDGSLDLDEATLGHLDLVVASVHSHFGLSKAAMTRRITRALQHPRVHVLGHPTGRLIGKREPYAVDLDAVFHAAHDHGVLLEINAQPDRLDLDDVHVRAARDAGVRLTISTDAHRVPELDWMRFGVDQARRGWCTAHDIANTRPLADLRRLLRR